MHAAWDETLKEVFHERNLIAGTQLCYTWANQGQRPTPEQLQGAEVVRLSVELIAQLDPFSIQLLKSELIPFWGSIERGLEQGGICYCVLDENKVVSMCYSSFIHGSLRAVGIVTDPAYRGKRYAYHAATAIIEEILSLNCIPYWDCSDSNIASRKLAEKLGFIRTSDYLCHDFTF